MNYDVYKCAWLIIVVHDIYYIRFLKMRRNIYRAGKSVFLPVIFFSHIATGAVWYVRYVTCTRLDYTRHCIRMFYCCFPCTHYFI